MLENVPSDLNNDSSQSIFELNPFEKFTSKLFKNLLTKENMQKLIQMRE